VLLPPRSEANQHPTYKLTTVLLLLFVSKVWQCERSEHKLQTPNHPQPKTTKKPKKEDHSRHNLKLATIRGRGSLYALHHVACTCRAWKSRKAAVGGPTMHFFVFFFFFFVGFPERWGARDGEAHFIGSLGFQRPTLGDP
jgi:hypothetical protein